MSTKGGKQGKKMTAITVALKIHVRWGGHQNLDRYFFLQKKGIELLTALASFENTIVPFNFGHLNSRHTFWYFFLFAKKKKKKILASKEIKKNYFLVGAQQVYLHKCLQVSRFFFSVLRWGIFVIVDKLFF